jgi:hypothetical protein
MVAPFKQEAASLPEFVITLCRGLLEEVRTTITEGTAPNCFMRTFLEKQDEYGLSDDEGAYVIGTFFEAGADTTVSLDIPRRCIKIRLGQFFVTGKPSLPLSSRPDQRPEKHAAAMMSSCLAMCHYHQWQTEMQKGLMKLSEMVVCLGLMIYHP